VVYLIRSRIALLSLLATFCIVIPASAGEIHDLLWKGEIEKAKALLAKDPELKDARDDYQRTPLYIAVEKGQLEVAELLLELGADVNARAYNDFVPLRFAKEPAMVKLLIAHKADVGGRALQDATDSYRRWCEFEPDSTEAEKDKRRKVAENWRTITKTLLDAGAYYDIYSAISLDDLNRVKSLLKDMPPLALDKGVLRHAARSGRVTVVKLLLDHKADPKDSGDDGLPVLYFALDYPDVVRVLIQAGTDPKLRVVYHGPGQFSTEWLLTAAALRGQVETARLLIEAGADVNCRSGANNTTPLWEAAFSGHPEMVKFLLKHKAKIQGEYGHGAMTVAASRIRNPGGDAAEIARYKSVITILREAGVPPDLPTAVIVGDIDIVRKLLKEQQGQTDTKDWNGKPILTTAVGLDHKEIVATLLDAGFPIHGTDEDGDTVLHSAAFWGREEIARLLICRHADVNARTKYLNTPLHEAARRGRTGIAKLLLAAGADVHAKDEKGKTPVAWAKESDKEMIELLKKHGGK
jgi:ankyrin repeat protein